MMHIAYPNAHLGQFAGCVRYLSLPPSQAPGPPYQEAKPRTPHLQAVHAAVLDLVPERAEQLDQGTVGQVYERADQDGPWQGASLDLAYFLALIRCSRRCVLEVCADLGDVWCTGELEVLGNTRHLKFVDQRGFDAKLAGFLAQAHDGDRLFFVPTANVDTPSQRDLCRAHQVPVIPLRAFRKDLTAARAAGGRLDPAVVTVGTGELDVLADMLFAPPRPLPWPRPTLIESRPRPYKFLDAFGPADAALFCGRDHEIEQLQQMLTASRLLVLYGASGTGKTSLLQAGLLPSLPVERYAWVVVRMVDAEPTVAIKAALIREFALDPQLFTQPLLDGVQAATAALGKTVVLILDQFEEFFQRHARAVRQQLHEELRACVDAVHLDLHVVIALRADYFSNLAEFQEDGTIPTIFHHTRRLTRFSPAQAYDAVVQPAQRLGLSIDTAFVQDVLLPQLTDAEHTIDLPMLQIVCYAWYKEAALDKAEAHQTAVSKVEDATLGEAAYTALGDIRTVLGHYLDTTVQQFGPEHAQARAVLKALVSTEDTQRAVFRDELLSRLHTVGVPLATEALEQRLLPRLVQARLVRATEVEGQTRYELTHEFLVAEIAAWIEADERERTKVLELITREYEVYQTTGLLLSPDALAKIKPFQKKLVLPDEQRAFLVRSQQRARQKRLGLWLRVVGLVVTAIGLVLLLLHLRQEFSLPQVTMEPQVTMAVSFSHSELLAISEVGRQLEDTLGAQVVLQNIDPNILVPTLEQRVVANTRPWDLISVDNDTLGLLVQKGLVRELSQYQLDKALPRDPLFQDLQKKLRIDGRDYFVPFHPNVKLMYYNQDVLDKAGKQPPTTWEELVQLARDLHDRGSWGRVAIQAHAGKAAAVTVFEWVTSMGGNPLTLDDEGAQQAFSLLWNLAPYLEPESSNIQFDTANNVLITNKVSVVDNWTYGIKVVMGDFEKQNIKVTPGLRGSVHVLGGDVLAIPTNAPHPERAIKLIEQLVAKKTQRALAEKLFWAPVREDVYRALRTAGVKEYFDVIQTTLKTAVMRPITASWDRIGEILSDALLNVLLQGQAANGNPATDEAIKALLRPYAALLRWIQHEYIPCAVVRKKTADDGRCEVEVQTEKSFEELAHEFKTTPAILAKVNGRGESEPVSLKNMQILLVPKPVPRN